MLVTPKPLHVVQIGDRVKIECIAHGYPEPYVYWTKGRCFEVPTKSTTWQQVDHLRSQIMFLSETRVAPNTAVVPKVVYYFLTPRI